MIFSPQYLTTVIPYEKKAGSPSVEDLQILTKSEHTNTQTHTHIMIKCGFLLGLFILQP